DVCSSDLKTMSSGPTPILLTAAARIWLVAKVSEPPNSRPETRTARSAPRASSSRSMPSAGGGPMVTTTTSQPVASFSLRAASRAFRSSGLVMVAIEARSRVPSGLTATLPEVSGTCLTQTIAFIVTLPSLLQQRARDDHHLHLAGALVDLGDLGVAHHPLDRIVAGVAVTAKELQAAAGHVAGRAGGDQLGLGGLDAVADLLAVHGVLLLQGGGVDQVLGGVHTGLHLGQLELGVLELGDAAAKLLALLDVGHGLVDGAFRNAQGLGGDADAAAVQGRHGQLEAAALDAQQAVLGDQAVFHDQLAGGGAADAHLLLGLADLEAGVGALDDEGGDLLGLAAALVHHGAGDGNDDEHVGKACVGDKDLGAVQQPAVLTLHGVGLLALGVGAGAGLGQAESAQPLAAAQLGQVLGLLLGGAVLVNGRSAQRGVGRQDHAGGATDLAHLLNGHDVAQHVASGAAHAGGEINAHHPQLAHLLDGLFGEVFFGVHLF